MANLTLIYVLLAGSIALSGCGGRVPSTVALAPVTTAQVQPTAEPTAEPTAVPSPTPDPLDPLRERVYVVLGNPFDAESFREANAKTAEQEATLLASVPEGDVAAAFDSYLDNYRIIGNFTEAQRMIQDRLSCDPQSYFAIDPATMVVANAFKVWGDSAADLDTYLETAGVPSTSERHYIIVDCDDPQSRAAGVQQAATMAAESERRIVSDENVAETALSAMIRGVIRDSFGVELPSQVEFSGTTFSELRILDSDRRLVAVEYFDIAEMDQDRASALSNIFHEDPRYEFERRYVGGFALSPDPAVPVGAAMEGGTAAVPAAINAVAHQLIAPYPLGNGEGSDGRAIAETFSIILERELTRRLVETYYGDPVGLREYAGVFEHGFDGAGRHLPLPPTRRDPDGVYGSGPLAQAVFELRNCGLDHGQTIGEFFSLMRPIDNAELLSVQIQDCEVSLTVPPSTAEPAIEDLPITYEAFSTRMPGTDWSRSPAEIDCLPQLAEAEDCSAVAFGYTGIRYYVRFALRAYVARFPDASAAAQTSLALRDELLALGTPLDFPGWTYIAGLHYAGAWMIRDQNTGRVVLGFRTAEALAVLSIPSGLSGDFEYAYYSLIEFAVAQYDRLIDFGYRAVSPHEPDCAQTGETTSNALTNPSFEATPGTNPTMWVANPAGADLIAEWTGARARTGDHSLRLTASRAGNNLGWPGWFTSELMRLCPNRQHVLRAWVSSLDGGEASLAIDVFDNLGRHAWGVSSGCMALPADGQGSWEELIVTLDPVQFDGAMVRLGLQLCMTTSNETVRSLYYDDVFFGESPR